MIGRLGFRVRRRAAYASTLVLVACVGHALQGELPIGARGLAEGQVISQQVDRSPIVDGRMDPVWDAAPVRRIPLTRKTPSPGKAVEVELRSLYTDGAVYFFAVWEEAHPTDSGGNIRNRFVLHFDLEEPWPGARDVACLVACHTAFSDGKGKVAHVIAETIPQGASDPLPAAGGWAAGEWRLEWSRPLVNNNPFDVQLQDLNLGYPFFVKVFEWVEGRADPVSEDLALVFRR
jgi:hypothetical protein